MNSALKPVLTSSTQQNPPVTTQLAKPMHPQGTPPNYGQPSTHMPQSLVNLPHNPTIVHSHPNPAHQTNHYSLNVPNAPQHYTPNNPSTIPASNHPVPNVSQAAQYSPNKAASFAGGYQPNLGHPPNQNPMPPVSQTLPATQPVHHTEASPEKPQSNGTTEAKSPTKPEPQENHVSLPKDKSPAPPTSPKACERTEEVKSEVPEKQVEEAAETKNSPSEASTAETVAEDAAETTTPSKPDDVDSADTNSRDSQPEVTESEDNTTELPPKVKDKEQKATSPPKTIAKVTRKSKTSKSDSDSPKTSKAESKTPQKSPSVGAKSKRTRTKTQPYQSPLPEIEIITKISTSTPRTKAADDKLIVFYKNEFLAVRNSEGSFYICQAVQNIYKTSPKIRIRWLSQDKTEKSGEVYTPDFYDNTDFDCILTNLNLVRVDKGRFRLPPAEKERTDSILKRSLAVEKGEVTSPSLTEEHPDGIDVSLYKEESQLKKRKAKKRKASSPLRARRTSTTAVKSPDQPKVRNVAVKTPKKPVTKTRSVAGAAATSKAKKPAPEAAKRAAASTSRTDRAKRRSDSQNHNKVSPVVDQKKARVLAKVARKGAVNTAARNQSAAKKQAPKAAKAPKAAPKTAAKKAKRSRK